MTAAIAAEAPAEQIVDSDSYREARVIIFGDAQGSGRSAIMHFFVQAALRERAPAQQIAERWG
jgi:hypothetical protein